MENKYNDMPPAQQQPTADQIAEMQAQQQQQMQQPQQPQQQHGDDIAQAKSLLGIDQQASSIEQLQNRIDEMTRNEISSEMSRKYPGIPLDLVEKEIAKVEAISPEFAKKMRSTKDGMEMAYRAAKVAIEPQEDPDKITEGEGSPSREYLEDAVKGGKANDFDLGDYILGVQ